MVGGVGEVLGWVGRLWAAKNVDSHPAFIIQIVLLVIMPCFFSAALYGVTGQLIRLLGPAYSPLGSVSAGEERPTQAIGADRWLTRYLQQTKVVPDHLLHG